MESSVEALQREVARLGRIERRMERLLQVTSELAAAQTADEVARITIDKGIDAVGASYGGLWLIDRETRTLRLLAVSTLPRGDVAKWAVVPLDIEAPLSEVARTSQPVILESLDDYRARYPASFERIRETISSPDSAYAQLPVAGNGPATAALALTYERAADLDTNERTYLSLLTRQCGLALERVRLHEELERAYREEREAHLEAEEATRAREEILSVVSHDLRNPLGTILMGASTLLQTAEGTDPKAQRVRTVAERIHRQSERMARLIDDLVDFAGIQAGKLTINDAPCLPSAIIASAAELLCPLVHERGLAFETQAAPDLPSLPCDFERGVQVLSNLVTNALKVTPKNGRVTIGAEQAGDEVAFFVRDTGPGIEREELPRLFERNWRSKRSSYQGTGLGLSIARGIVDAHRGRIWAESELGQGSTFYFTLCPKR